MLRDTRYEATAVIPPAQRSSAASVGLRQRVASGLLTDVRVAIRRVRAAPVCAVFAILSLGLGLGLTTTAYSIIDTLLWQAAPLAEPQRLAFVTRPSSRAGSPRWRAIMSRADFAVLRSRQRCFSPLVASVPFRRGLVAPETADIVDGEAVTGDYFEALGITASLGRMIRPADERESRAVMVISHRVWRKRFAAHPGIIGRVVRLGGHPFRIIGVAQPSFDGLTEVPQVGTAAWVPIGSQPWFAESSAVGSSEAWREELTVVGRLAAGVTTASAASEIAALARRLDSVNPLRTSRAGDARSAGFRRWSIWLATDARASFTGAASSLGVFIVCLVALLLVTACANLAHLMLARGAVRRDDLAIRRGLGASRWDLVRLQLVESAILAALGGAVGLGITQPLLAAASIQVPTARGVFYLEPRLSLAALVIAAAALVLSIVVFGLAPALLLTRERASSELTAPAGASVVPASRRHRRLICGQVAMTTCLFLVAAIVAKVVVADALHDSGVALGEVAIATLHPQSLGLDEKRARHVFEFALEEARHDRALQSVAGSSGLPFGLIAPFATVTTPDKPLVGRGQRPSTLVIPATPGIFSTLGVPILRGRAFDERDDETAPRVAVVSERMAREMFGAASAVGRRVVLEMWSRPPAETVTVVGIARDTDTTTLASRRDWLLWVPFAQHYEPIFVLVARSRDPAGALHALQAAVRRADPDLATGAVGTGTQLLSGALLAARIAAYLAVGLGVLTWMFAIIGLYGIQTYLVSCRTRELGVRAALGATAGQIERLVLAEGTRSVGEGLAIGLLLGALARLVVRGIVAAPMQIFDPVVFAAVPVALAVVAGLACHMPARRASRIEPSVALRHL